MYVRHSLLREKVVGSLYAFIHAVDSPIHSKYKSNSKILLIYENFLCYWFQKTPKCLDKTNDSE